ncbi:hypothetical protein NDA13_000134 [Ustilago tritici]|nr:hypothetical protein NDA13_000134 [Ustilago tritici]
MSAKSPVKRISMISAVSVADRARRFQSASSSSSTTTTAVPSTHKPARPANSITRNSQPMISSELAPSTTYTASSPVLLRTEAGTFSSGATLAHEGLETAVVTTIKHARRISVSTPMHCRARSDVSLLDPMLSKETPNTTSINKTANPPTIRMSFFAELDELTAKLEASRPRSKTLANPSYRGRSSELKQSIAEESMHLSLCSSTETIRGTLYATNARGIAAIANTHNRIEVSPCLSDDGSIDWHTFVSGSYAAAPVQMRGPISITDLAFPMSNRKRVYESKLCKADSPTLNEEATWLEEELARCSSDEEDGDEYESQGTVRHSMGEEYLTPDGSPLLSPVNLTAAPEVEIMGLGIQDVSLVLPGAAKEEKASDSLLEQVAMHEACIATLKSLGKEEREQASAAAVAACASNRGLGLPSMPSRMSSLTVPSFPHPALRNATSNGDFTSTQCSDSAALFGEDTDDASMSTMADMDHSTPSNDMFSFTDSAGERRASAASYLSTDSTASADISIASHGSSLLYSSHLAAPGMERRESDDTVISTRSSIASSYCNEKVQGPVKPPRSPFRMNSMPLPPLPQQQGEDYETPQPSFSQGEAQLVKPPRSPLSMNAMPLPPLPQETVEGKPRASVLRQASRRRKEAAEHPQLPARLGSLDAVVAAAPKEQQVKKEFPDRLLGDWMAATSNAASTEQVIDNVSVEPIPLNERIQKADGTTYLPGIGEIVASSPDVLMLNIPVYPRTHVRKRLGLQPSPWLLSDAPLPPLPSSAGMTKSTTLKSKLSGRLGISAIPDTPESSTRGERKMSESSSKPNVLGRMRRSSGKSESDRARLSSAAALTAAELPAAWKDRIVSAAKRPSMDMRRPSIASITSNITSTTHSSCSTTAIATQAAKGSTLLPTARDEGRSRSSLGFRKMFSSIAGVSDSPPTSIETDSKDSGEVKTLEALAANTFESPKSARQTLQSNSSLRRTAGAKVAQQEKFASFIELSDESEQSSDEAEMEMTKVRGRKDLTKMFGASQVEISQPQPRSTGVVKGGEGEKKWTASLGRSATKKRSGLW